MEHKINAGGQLLTITDAHNLLGIDTLELELSEELETEIVEDNEPVSIENELEQIATTGCLQASF